MTEHTEIKIRSRAYALWLEHGCEEGRDMDFWLLAEREILGGGTSPDAAPAAKPAVAAKPKTEAKPKAPAKPKAEAKPKAPAKPKAAAKPKAPAKPKTGPQ